MSVNQEKRLKKFEKEFSFYTSHPYYNVIKSLYVNGDFKTIPSASKQFRKIKITKTGSVFKSSAQAVKQLNKYKKEFHVMAIFKIKTTYNDSKKNTYITTFKESRLIKAFTFDEAKQIMKEELKNDYEFETSSTLEIIISFKFSNEQINTPTTSKISLGSIKMKQCIINYNHIIEDQKYLNMKDTKCVINNFCGFFGISEEKLIKYCETFYKMETPLDIFNIADGICSKCLRYICHQLDISMYAFDFNDECILKNISTNRNKKALMFYTIDSHMYLITDEKIRKKLYEKAKQNEISSSLIKDTEKYQNIYALYNIVENVDISNIKNYESSIFMFSNSSISNLNDVFIKVYEQYKIIPSKIRTIKSNITYFELNLEGKNYYFVIDANDTKRINYKDTIELCNKNQIEFKNQSYISVIRQIKDKLYNKQITNNDETDIDEKENKFIEIKETESSFNFRVQNIMTSELNRPLAFVKTINEPDQDKKLFSIDINKCRTEILLNTMYNWAVYTVMDDVEVYNKSIHNNAGLYYIEQDKPVYPKEKNNFPLRGNGWYSLPMVDYCIKNKIIKHSEIKYTIQASINLPNNYFNEFVNMIKSTEPSNYKFAINSFIGSLKPNQTKNKKWSILCITRSKEEASEYFLKYNGKFIESFQMDNQTFYKVYKEIENTKTETEAPIYNQILDLEAIELHKLTQLIENKGGNIIDLKTDCVVCTFSNDIFPFELSENNLTNYLYSQTKNYKYKIEIKDEHRLKIKKNSNKLFNTIYEHFEEKWNIKTDQQIISSENKNDFTELINYILNCQSCHIDGRAGTGKSKLLKDIQKELTSRKLKFITLTPTNKSACIVNGQTLHKFFSETNTKKAFNKLNLNYILIDEISMMSEIFYKYLITLSNAKPNIKFIISGDFKQLEPVNDRVICNYKESRALFELCSGFRVELMQCRRADDKLYNLLKNVNTINTSIFTDKLNKINLAYTNKKCQQINKIFMTKNKESNSIYLDKLPNNKKSQDVIISSNMPIIAKINKKSLHIINNDNYIIKSYDQENIIVRKQTPSIQAEDKTKLLNEKLEKAKKQKKSITEIKQQIEENNKLIYNEIQIPINEFQSLFMPAYCITIHKSQGITINEDYTVYEWEKLDERLKYVALSRATNEKLINII